MSELYPVLSRVPQGSLMGQILYLIFTADLPLSENAVTGTFADDTAVLSVDSDPIKPSQKLRPAWTKFVDGPNAGVSKQMKRNQ